MKLSKIIACVYLRSEITWNSDCFEEIRWRILLATAHYAEVDREKLTI